MFPFMRQVVEKPRNKPGLISCQCHPERRAFCDAKDFVLGKKAALAGPNALPAQFTQLSGREGGSSFCFFMYVWNRFLFC